MQVKGSELPFWMVYQMGETILERCIKKLFAIFV